MKKTVLYLFTILFCQEVFACGTPVGMTSLSEVSVEYSKRKCIKANDNYESLCNKSYFLFDFQSPKWLFHSETNFCSERDKTVLRKAYISMNAPVVVLPALILIISLVGRKFRNKKIPISQSNT